ncbi:MAG: MCE family protein [Lapillicoccus sp.]
MREPGRRPPRSQRIRVVIAALLVGLTTTTLGGCALSGGLYDLPLPGGPAIGSNGYEVTAEFTDALDLVPQAAVKSGNVPVGKVTKIALRADGRAAVVTLLVNGDVLLPANATARIQQSSLLGEKYVSLDRPLLAPTGSLRAVGRIGIEGTSESVDAERVLGAMSLLLNGGGIAQMQDISRELAHVSVGREGEIRAFLTNVDSFVTTLNTRKESITNALDSLNRLSLTLKANEGQLTTALDQLPPGLAVLAEQRTQLVAMLKALDSLSSVTVDTLDKSQADMVADLRRLDPILTQLAASGQALPDALQILFTFPFPDSVLGAIKGDYVNAFLVTNLSTPGTTIPAPTAASWPQGYAAVLGATPSGDALTQITPPPMLLPSTSSAAPGISTPTVTTTGPTTPTGTPTGTTGTGGTTPTGGTGPPTTPPSTGGTSPVTPPSTTTTSPNPTTSPGPTRTPTSRPTSTGRAGGGR